MNSAISAWLSVLVTLCLFDLGASVSITVCPKEKRIIGNTCSIVCHVRDVTNDILFKKNGTQIQGCTGGSCGTKISLDRTLQTVTLALGPLTYNDESEYSCQEVSDEAKFTLVVLSKIEELQCSSALSRKNILVGYFCLTDNSAKEITVSLNTKSITVGPLKPLATAATGITCTSPENPKEVAIPNPSCTDSTQGQTNFNMVVNLGVQLQCSFLYTCEALCKCLPVMNLGVVAAAAIVIVILFVKKTSFGIVSNCKLIGVPLAILVVCFCIVIALDFGLNCHTKGCSCEVCDVRYSVGISVSCVLSTCFCLIALLIMKNRDHGDSTPKDSNMIIGYQNQEHQRISADGERSVQKTEQIIFSLGAKDNNTMFCMNEKSSLPRLTFR